jgi:hypothetical protein
VQIRISRIILAPQSQSLSLPSPGLLAARAGTPFPHRRPTAGGFRAPFFRFSPVIICRLPFAAKVKSKEMGSYSCVPTVELSHFVVTATWRLRPETEALATKLRAGQVKLPQPRCDAPLR